MNKLEATTRKLNKFPKQIRSFILNQGIPYTGTSRIFFEEISPEKVVTSVKNKRRVRNHIGQIHAAAMILLAETATGVVVGMNVSDDKMVLVKSLKTDFVRRSKGAMKAVATLNQEQQAQMKTTPKGEVIVPVTITDETGEEPIKVEALWAWTPKKK